MTIDCDRCTVRGAACASCAVPFVAGTVTFVAGTVTFVTDAVPARRGQRGKPAPIELDAAELRALAALANAGLIPPLRYAPPMAKAS
jgi:hypothetical protein